MRIATLACVLAVLMCVTIAVSTEPQFETEAQKRSLAERAFRAAMSAWAYGEYWRLYAMGNKESQAGLSENDFVEEMRRGTSSPGVGLEILDVRIAGIHAVIEAKVQMEYRGLLPYASNRLYPGSRSGVSGSGYETIQVMLVYQEGDWRINVHQFVGLSRY